MSELYFSIDIEADGPIPAHYSMLSFGCAAFDNKGTLLDTFSANVEPLPDAKEHPDTMAWWATQPEAWAACHTNVIKCNDAMKEFVAWVEILCKDHKAKPVAIGFPMGYDWMWMYWYLIAFVGYSPFSFSALDIKTAAAIILDIDYRRAIKRNFPKRWFGKTPHTHVGVEDAIGQGEMFFNMLKDNKNAKR